MKRKTKIDIDDLIDFSSKTVNSIRILLAQPMGRR